MQKRTIKEINAGSMADIAFLLLIFFLVTTTMDTEWVIEREMAANTTGEPPHIDARYLFEIKLNMEDQIMVEEDVITLDELKQRALDFYLNPEQRTDLPMRQSITRELCYAKLDEHANTPDSLEVWQQRLLAVDFFGSYERLPSYAAIALRTDDQTSYDFYIGVHDAIQSAVNELRNEFSLKHFGRKFTDLDPGSKPDQQKIMALRQVYPQIISEVPHPEILAAQ